MSSLGQTWGSLTCRSLREEAHLGRSPIAGLPPQALHHSRKGHSTESRACQGLRGRRTNRYNVWGSEAALRRWKHAATHPAKHTEGATPRATAPQANCGLGVTRTRRAWPIHCNRCTALGRDARTRETRRVRGQSRHGKHLPSILLWT